MIEVLFSESAAESMKCAKSSRTAPYSKDDGPTSVLGNKSLIPKRKKAWTAVPGTPAEVICLAFMLDIGDIRQPADSDTRLKILTHIHTWIDAETFLRYKKDYKRLKELAASGSAIRIWYSHAPYAYCGLCWLCHEFRNMNAEISVIDLPEYDMHSETSIVRYCSWNEVEHERFSEYLDREKHLTALERRMYAQEWSEASDSNSMLRAVVNGKLLSVPEEFYDFLILNRITEQPEKEARIIGDILGNSHIAVSDGWYAYRIQKMIDEGRIGMAEEDESEPYKRMIYKK